jgi:hypothetical protein
MMSRKLINPPQNTAKCRAMMVTRHIIAPIFDLPLPREALERDIEGHQHATVDLEPIGLVASKNLIELPMKGYSHGATWAGLRASLLLEKKPKKLTTTSIARRLSIPD